ncbi:MAG: hypothetical protein FWE16_05710 [Firmicutes bacterium]|nr:hypothetical protein [Bacillota bacterium]
MQNIQQEMIRASSRLGKLYLPPFKCVDMEPIAKDLGEPLKVVKREIESSGMASFSHDQFPELPNSLSRIIGDIVQELKKIIPFEYYTATKSIRGHYNFNQQRVLHNIHIPRQYYGDGYDIVPGDATQGDFGFFRNDKKIAEAVFALLHEFYHVIQGDKIHVRPDPSPEIIKAAIEWTIENSNRKWYENNHAGLSSEIAANEFSREHFQRFLGRYLPDNNKDVNFPTVQGKRKSIERFDFLKPGEAKRIQSIDNSVDQDLETFKLLVDRRPGTVADKIVFLKSPEMMSMIKGEARNLMLRQEDHVGNVLKRGYEREELPF